MIERFKQYVAESPEVIIALCFLVGLGLGYWIFYLLVVISIGGGSLGFLGLIFLLIGAYFVTIFFVAYQIKRIGFAAVLIISSLIGIAFFPSRIYFQNREFYKSIAEIDELSLYADEIANKTVINIREVCFSYWQSDNETTFGDPRWQLSLHGVITIPEYDAQGKNITPRFLKYANIFPNLFPDVMNAKDGKNNGDEIPINTYGSVDFSGESKYLLAEISLPRSRGELPEKYRNSEYNDFFVDFGYTLISGGPVFQIKREMLPKTISVVLSRYLQWEEFDKSYNLCEPTD